MRDSGVHGIFEKLRYWASNYLPNTDSDKIRAANYHKESQKPMQLNHDLEVFPNPNPEQDYTVRIEIPEFTCLCPVTGQPDFANLLLEYVPDSKCVELKSLKLYVWSYRDQGAFHEAVTNLIKKDLVDMLAPRFLRLTGKFNVRGGLYPTVIVEHRKQGWQAQQPVTLP